MATLYTAAVIIFFTDGGAEFTSPGDNYLQP